MSGFSLLFSYYHIFQNPERGLLGVYFSKNEGRSLLMGAPFFYAIMLAFLLDVEYPAKPLLLPDLLI